ncbi:MAG: aconitase X catalytic domain-containing protein [Thermodesulfobacteriota bacterium]
MVKLLDIHKRMLDGEFGEPVRQSMEIIAQLADFWEAPDIIPVRSVHMPGAAAKTARRAGRKYIRWAADSGGRFCTPTTLNTGSADLTGIDMGIQPGTMAQQLEITDSYQRMGAIECHTCTPYMVGNLPRFGEHLAWGESSAVVFANSILGARTNREGGPAALASALTGFTAGYGLHLKKNRAATVHASVDCPLSDVSEFGAAGYFLAKLFPDALPVFTGLPEQSPMFGLKSMGAALASSGSIAMFHAIGLTPEAPTLEMTAGGKKLETVHIGKKELEETGQFLSRTNDSTEIDCVFLGCPHLDFEEVLLLTKLLAGRKVHPDVSLWLYAANSFWSSCERSGLTRPLRDSGAMLLSDTCPSISIFSEIMESKGFRSAATNSAKQAHYLPVWGMKVHFGSTSACIEAAVTGKWKH